MFKFDQLKNILNCDQCNQLLVDPVTIACGYSVCKGHLDKLLENSPSETDKFDCELCEKEHRVPEEGFVVNKGMQSGLDVKFNTLRINVSMYDQCKNEIERTRENLANLKPLLKDSANFIYEYFEDIKRRVDLRRGDLKMKIGTYSDDIF